MIFSKNLPNMTGIRNLVQIGSWEAMKGDPNIRHLKHCILFPPFILPCIKVGHYKEGD